MHQLTILSLLLSLLVSGSAAADRNEPEKDHERVYRARQDARILPLETILEKLDLGKETRLLEVEHELEHGQDIYEIEYLTPDGDIIEIEVDAATGRILKREQE
ncbi:MAG: PepSY domain-containing protein [Gammaproteobacteria bacterium]|jgi:uncharacterized membrane protein YkoI